MTNRIWRRAFSLVVLVTILALIARIGIREQEFQGAGLSSGELGPESGSGHGAELPGRLESVLADKNSFESGNRALVKSHADGVIVDIVLLGPTGQPLTSGRIRLAAGNEFMPETTVGAHIESHRVIDEVTSVFVPTSLQNLMIEATCSGLWGRSRVINLHSKVAAAPVAEEPGADPGRYTVRLTLDRPDVDGRVWGAIFVDGVQRLPEGATITLQQRASVGGTFVDYLEGGRQTGIIDAAASTYSVGPVNSTASGLLATSREAPPVWMSLGRDERHGNVDIHFSQGETVRFQFVQRGTGVPLAGIVVSFDQSLHFPTEGGNIHQGDHVWTEVADGIGVCDVQSLSKEGRLTARVPGTQSAHEVLVLDMFVDELLELQQPVTVEVSVDGDYRGVVWGGTAGSGGDTEATAIEFLRENGESEVHAADRNSDEWEVALDPGEYQLWGIREEAGVRVRTTDIVQVAIQAGARIGPIELSPLQFSKRELSWSNKPSGASLEVSIEDGMGALPSPSDSEVQGEGGSFRLPFNYSGFAVFDLRYSPAVFVRHRVEIRAHEVEDIAVDLSGGQERTISLGDLPEGRGDGILVLHNLIAPGHGATVLAMIDLQGGTTGTAAALPAGRYYYATHTTVPAFVCGVLELPGGGKGGRIVVHCGATQHKFAELGGESTDVFEVNQADGVELADFVPLYLRTFSLKRESADGVGPDPDVWVRLGLTTWAPRGDQD